MLAGALLAFASIDDFVTSNFVSGSATTFPLWVGRVKVGIPPQVFVLGTMIFVVGIGFAVLNLVWQARRTDRPRGPAESSRPVSSSSRRSSSVGRVPPW